MTVYTSHDYLPNPAFPFTVQRYTIMPNEVIPEHTHEFVELVFVESGNAEHVMAGQRYELTSGDVFVIEPSIYHSYLGSAGETTVVYNVLFSTDFIRNDLHALMEMSSFVHLFYLAPFLRRTRGFVTHASLTDTESSRLINSLTLLLEEINEQDSGYQLASKALLINMLIFLSRCYEKHVQENKPVLRIHTHMDTIMAFVRQNHASPLRVKHISQSFGIGTSTLLTRFKQHTGMTLLQYKHQIQIQEACRLLAETDEKIVDVGQTVGFDDLSFFYRVFRRVTHMTPVQYRSKMQE